MTKLRSNLSGSSNVPSHQYCFRTVKPKPDATVLQWLQTDSSSQFYISALSISKLEQSGEP
ncbi:MAG: hypothetical protein ACRCYY_08920 [Trueperaceae bacterium]